MDIQDDRSNLLIFSGNANKKLANDICHELGVRPGKALVSKFSDGEVQVEILHHLVGVVAAVQPA